MDAGEKRKDCHVYDAFSISYRAGRVFGAGIPHAESDKKAECGRVCAACKRVPRAAKAAFRAENGRIRSGGKIFSAA